MSLVKNKPEWKHSPRLNTVIMVENTLKEMDNSMITVAELKKILPKQVNHNVLKRILEYLEESGKIAVTMKGISWVHNKNRNLREVIRKGKEL
ncbi:MAG: hypothetical protein ACQEP1_00505 [Nanobdellota archaeon]